MGNKYLFFDGTLEEGGAERVISIITKKLSENPENTVEILIYYDSEPFYPVDERVKLTRVEKQTGSKNIFKNLLYMRKFFKNFDGVVISFLAPFNILALVAHFGLNGKIIVADRNDPRKVPTNRFVRFLRDFLYRFADGIVLQTIRNQKYFSKKIQEKSTVIYNPVTLGENVAISLNTPRKKHIVTAARLVPQKNQKMLVDAFSDIAEEFPDYIVNFYGDGPLKEELQEYINSKNLADKMFLCGAISNVPETITNAACFVLTSDYEGMPNALIEAMCVGLPVISTKVSGATDLVVDGENGLLVDVGDKDALADALRRVLSNDKFAEKLAQNAAALNDELEVTKIVEQWQEFANL